MKKFLRGIAFSLVSLFLLNTAAFASETDITRASSYIANSGAAISADADCQLRITFSIQGTARMSELGATTIYLYEDNGYLSKLVKTYQSSDSNYSNMMDANTFYHGSDVTYEGIAGYKYYAIVNFKAGNSTGSDTTVGQTDVVTARK